MNRLAVRAEGFALPLIAIADKSKVLDEGADLHVERGHSTKAIAVGAFMYEVIEEASGLFFPVGVISLRRCHLFSDTTKVVKRQASCRPVAVMLQGENDCSAEFDDRIEAISRAR